MGSSSDVEVSVVLPAYNEEASLKRTTQLTLDALETFLPAGRFEVIIAEDGCTDRTPEIAADLARKDDRVEHVHADERLGRGRALTEAFAAADGETIAYFDTDLATDLRHLPELIESVRSGEYDVATGSRWVPGHEADRPVKRGVPSRLYNGLARIVLGSRLRDHQCGFKAFDREVLTTLLPEVRDAHWFWDTEVLVHAQRAGYRVKEFPVEWTPQGETKVDLVRDVLGMGSQVVRLGWELRVEPHATRRRSIAVGVLLTVFALALMTLYIDFGAVLAQMERADRAMVGTAALVYVLSWPIRGARYRRILARLGYHEGVGFLTGAVFISQTGNLVFPARTGDAVRAYVVKTRRAVPYPTGFASLAVERIFDLLTITALAGTVMVLLGASGGPFVTVPWRTGPEPVVQSGRTAVLVAGVVGAGALVAVAAILASARSERNRIEPWVNRLSDDSYARYLTDVLERFVGDIQTVTATRASFAEVGIGSLLIWSIDVVTAAVVLAAFPAVTLPASTLLAVCFYAVSVGNLAKVLPITPGGIGLYEGAFTLLVIGTTGIPFEVALGAAIVDHAVKNLITVGGGVGSMVVLNVSLTEAVKEGREASPTEAD